jgi:hypothetical protein
LSAELHHHTQPAADFAGSTECSMQRYNKGLVYQVIL